MQIHKFLGVSLVGWGAKTAGVKVMTRMMMMTVYRMIMLMTDANSGGDAADKHSDRNGWSDGDRDLGYDDDDDDDDGVLERPFSA